MTQEFDSLWWSVDAGAPGWWQFSEILKLDLNGLYRYITKTAQLPLASLRAGSTLSHARAREAERKSVSKESHRIPFVITFNPAWRNIPQVISSNLNIFRSSQRCLEAFSSLPRISYRRCNNLRDILVRAKHRRQAPRLRELSVVTEIGPFIAEGTTSYTFFSTNEQRRIRHHITCFSSNLVGMLQCNKCNAQYIGETKRHLSDRFDEHRRGIEEAIAKQPIDNPTAVSDHSTLPAHSMDNIELAPLELITSNRDGIRKAREAFLICKGKTLETFGLSRPDEIWSSNFFVFLHISVLVQV